METKKSIGLAALVTSLALPACSDESLAIRTAEKAGWKDVTVIDSVSIQLPEGFSFLKFCKKGETEYRIKGKNPSEQETTTTVCCGQSYSLRHSSYIFRYSTDCKMSH